jgi:UDP:flavonoid glycosyltransferase YjiC (YdhE family)
MASIVILAAGTMGRINTSRNLANRLSERGHVVTIASPADIADRIGAFEGEFIALPAPPGPSGPATDRTMVARLRRQLESPLRWWTVADRRVVKLEGLGLDAWQAALAKRNPDVVVADLELPAHVMTAVAAGHRVVLWTTMLSVWRRPGLPPLHTSIVPGQGFRGSRTGIRLAWWRFSVWKWLRARRLWFTRAGEDQLSVAKLVATVIGFDWSGVDEYEWLLPFTFRSIPTLEFNASEIELPHTPHPWVHYVGPLLSRSPRSEKADPPLIYAGFGAWHRGDDTPAIEAVIGAVAKHPEWRLVVGLGGRRPPEDLSSAPNVDVRSWAPQAEMLVEASVAIHHAGINTINECIAAGTPMLAMPFDYGDTPGAAARLRYHRLGIVLDRATVDVDAVEAAIIELLDDPGYRQRVQNMAIAFSRYEGRAVQLIETQLT